jgi:N-acetyl-anhydromuramyl-L-alanine amidase AmpD
VGDFDNDYPTARQMQALVALVNELQERCHIPTSNVLMHRQVRPGGTRCPGRNFPFYEFISLLDH